MGTLFGTIFSFLVVFGVLVFIHEFGHFFTAKLVGIRVETFSFGYGKRLFGIRGKETDYRVSLIPMGGYVKFLGEGEIFAEGGTKSLPSDHFLAKTRWERFMVMVMGSAMNILLAVLIFTAINMVGVTVPAYQDETPVIGYIEPGSPAEKAGFRLEDEILFVDNGKVVTWSDVELAVGSKPDRLITVDFRRGGEAREIQLRTEKRTRYALGYAGFTGKFLTQIRLVKPSSPAEKAGLRQGDVILSVDGRPIYLYQFVEFLEKNPNRELEFVVSRLGETINLRVTPRLEGKVGKIGAYTEAQSVEKKYGLIGAAVQSVRDNVKNTFLIIRFVKDLILRRASTQQLGGPLEIASFSYAAWKMGFLAMLSWIGLISLQLGVINLFPIPVFDGGQIFVLALEALFRRDFSPKIRQIWMQVGFVIFVFLIVFVILNDIVKRMPNGWESLIPW
ncbi:MAG TPA: RIP metalloprotease RseP [Candidatus Aminicenantes bacterium]|nr:RIP metalloprotease RseP [Candidatus Aminicenantes bacterium]